MVVGLVISGTTIGLSIYFTKTPVTSTTIASITTVTTSSIPTTSLATTTPSTTRTTNKPDVKDYVLMLSTYNSSNVPMVIGING